ncbi:MAG: hypothetical protein PHR69_07635 [Sphaerochaeta sp.]|nr:hypothetical protein [Sphaerochaeta sp.]
MQEKCHKDGAALKTDYFGMHLTDSTYGCWMFRGNRWVDGLLDVGFSITSAAK